VIDLETQDQTYRLPTVEAPKGVKWQVWTVLPDDAPIGTARLRLRMNNVDYSDTLEIAPTAPGLLTSNYEGFGPAIATKTDFARVALTNPATPGQEIALYATGLAGAGTGDVSVEVAGQPAVVIAAARQTQFRGLDQINFIVPQDTFQGCYVPVQLRVRGVASNGATLAISDTPGTCDHPFGLSTEEMKSLDGGGSVRLANLRPASQWFDLGGFNWSEGVSVSFPYADATLLYLLAGPQLPAAMLYSCQSTPEPSPSSIPIDTPDAGTALTFNGPRSRGLTLPAPFYVSSAPPLEAPFFTPGTWTLRASGGADVPAFEHSITVAPVPSGTNVKRNDEPPVDRDFTVTWNPSGYSATDIMKVELGGGSHFVNGREILYPYYLCRVHAAEGRITIPQTQMPQFANQGTVALRLTAMPHPAARKAVRLTRTDGAPMTLYSDFQLVDVIQLLPK
jgi:hypothetical protein